MIRERVLNYIAKNRMLSQGQRVIVGLSGGADSVCLLSLLADLREEMDLKICAVHVHHGLRGQEADRDARFSEELCRKLDIPFFLVSADVNGEAERRRISQEEAGRILRYEAFEQKASEWELEQREETGGDSVRVAVAHHGDDSAETILYHLLRGSGLKGLSGIPAVRGRIIRPLLCVTREEITDFLKQRELAFVTDSTNLEVQYIRNRIRSHLIPMAEKEINQRAVEHILKAGELIGEADQFFRDRAEKLLTELEKSQTGNSYSEGFQLSFPISSILPLSHIEQTYLIRAAFSRIGSSLKDVEAGHVASVLALLNARTGAGVDLPGGLRAERSYENLLLGKAMIVSREEGEMFPTLSMEIVPWRKQGEIPKNQYTKWFDYDKIKDTLSVRGRLPGDYIILKGGGRKSLKSLFIDEKIPREERAKIALLAEGSHILWIIGGRISEYYKITEHTKRILKVHVDGGTNCG